MEGEEDDDEDDDQYDEDDSEKEEAKEELNDLKDNGSDEEDDVFGERVEKSGAEGEEVGEDAIIGQRRQREESVVDRRVLKRQKKALIQKYYSGSFFWKCASWTMYQLYQALNRSNNDSLWLWILGMTDLIVHQRQTLSSLDNDMLDCGNEVIRLNPNIYNRQDEQVDEETEENPQGAGTEKDLFKFVTLNSRNKEVGSIIVEQELKLMLLRHWTLYDSLCNSNYLVSKMILWKEQGQRDLKKMLAQMGIPLDQAKQKYQFMDPVLRTELKQRFIEHSEEFDLPNALINTFIR